MSSEITALAEAWGGHRSLDELLGHLDRRAGRTWLPARAVHRALRFDAADRRDPRWWPQGVTSSADASLDGSTDRVAGRRLLLVAWYAKRLPDDAEGAPHHGTRVTFLDLDSRRYRHVRLVVPVLRDGVPGVEPLRVHAGGLVWHGEYLHVAATAKGFHTIRLADLLRLPEGHRWSSLPRPDDRWSSLPRPDDRWSSLPRPDDRWSSLPRPDDRWSSLPRPDDRWSSLPRPDDRWSSLPRPEYVLPVRFSHRAGTEEGTEPLRYSFLSLDRSTQPASMIVGEYGRRGATQRLVRYALGADGLPLADPDGRCRPTSCGDGVGHMQGAVVALGRWHVTTSHGPWTFGSVHTGGPGTLRRHRWATPMGPEDLTYWPATDELWSVTEHPRRRWVYAMRRSWFD